MTDIQHFGHRTLLARHFGTQNDADLVGRQVPAEIPKRQFSNLSLYELKHMDSLGKIIRTLQLLAAAGGLSTIGIAVMTSPVALIPCIGVWYYLFIRPLIKIKQNAGSVVSKITITPEKDKLIFEYGYPVQQKTEIEIEKLETEVKIDPKASKRTIYVYLDADKKTAIKVGLPQQQDAVEIPDKELLMDCLFKRMNLLEHYEYEPAAQPA